MNACLQPNKTPRFFTVCVVFFIQSEYFPLVVCCCRIIWFVFFFGNALRLFCIKINTVTEWRSNLFIYLFFNLIPLHWNAKRKRVKRKEKSGKGEKIETETSGHLKASIQLHINCITVEKVGKICFAHRFFLPLYLTDN